MKLEYGDLTDEELRSAANALFVMYDDEEKQDGLRGTSMKSRRSLRKPCVS